MTSSRDWRAWWPFKDTKKPSGFSLWTSTVAARSHFETGFLLDWTTQAIGQQHTSPLRAGCEARRREIAVIFCCGNGLARDAPEASKVDWTT